MINKKIILLAIIVIVLILIGLGLFSVFNKSGENSPTATSTTKNIGGVILDTKGGDFTITEIPASNLPPFEVISQPNLDRKVNFSSDLSSEVVSILNKNISDLSSQLKKDPKDTNNWLSIGIQYKMAGDYIAARDAFAYAGSINQKLFVPFYNLGDLYNSYLKDYAKSEESYLRSIENNPQYVQSYEGIADLYRYSMKKNESVIKDFLINTALKANPKSIDLLSYTATYFKSIGDKVLAKEYYTKALNEAIDQKNTNLQGIFQTEIKNL